MKALRRLLVRLGLKREPSLAEITSPVAKILAELRDYADAKTDLACRDAEAAERLRDKSNEEAKAAQEARALSDRYATLTV